ncbi:MAG: PssD/Cps14F family polysaccharide biosynthesis glycosyltransferase [Cognaticolwellia sp.]
MKKKVILVIFGEGGHQKEMELLLSSLTKNADHKFISIGPTSLKSTIFQHYHCKDVRDKKSRIKSVYYMLAGLFSLIFTTFSIMKKYNIQGAISTGPGIAIVPFVLLRVVGIKTVFIESFCRFNTRSMAGKILYRVSHRFLVQNKQLLKLYPNAEYCGRL